ncbi:hypothetical protein [Streptacidiphilus sp. EB129]|uniref:hypothetical protein n=1 Tax=Streptacidiphilus sp. EB129 TaxID=3156262 RepID=UPI0035166B9C
MSDELPAPTQLPWRWEWVPKVRPDDEEYEAWTEHMVALFEDWTSEGLAAARLAWPKEAGIEFPFSSDMVGRGAAQWLLDRAGQLPAWSRVAWGAAFVEGSARWAPVPVVVEFRRPRAEDPNYLMEIVGATGIDSDARPPVVDYVTTPIGDGVQVFALGRTPEGAAFGRLDSAMRLDVPPRDGAPSVSTDVLLTTRVFEMGLMALISAGVEQLMQQIANDCAPPSDSGPARLGFVAATEGGQP